VAAEFHSILTLEAEKPEPSCWVEQRAVEIDDPVARLRYLRHAMAPVPPENKRRRGSATLPWLLVPLLVGLGPTRIHSTPISARAAVHAPVITPEDFGGEDPSIQSVWMVEQPKGAEVYSNGLRVELAYATRNRPRARFPIYSQDGSQPRHLEPKQWGDAPVGIVYHTTESHLAPFEEDSTRQLKRLGRNLLALLREQHSYHYLVDRFGRVFRVVEESQVAFHAGFSVWADGEGVYVNLNDSFLGVAFEGQTGSIDEVTPAQVISARMLTEMLRWRYRIAARNCVTHAQVSVNPDSMHIAAHTDWSRRFPFADLGLPDNYAIPLPSVRVFGFEYDATFLRAVGTPWNGLEQAEERVRQGATSEHASVAKYRSALQRRYKNILAEIREFNQGGT
jgi:hypothetical protein